MQNAVLQGLVKPRTADMAPLILIFNAHAHARAVICRFKSSQNNDLIEYSLKGAE